MAQIRSSRTRAESRTSPSSQLGRRSARPCRRIAAYGQVDDRPGHGVEGRGHRRGRGARGRSVSTSASSGALISVQPRRGPRDRARRRGDRRGGCSAAGRRPRACRGRRRRPPRPSPRRWRPRRRIRSSTPRLRAPAPGTARGRAARRRRGSRPGSRTGGRGCRPARRSRGRSPRRRPRGAPTAGRAPGPRRGSCRCRACEAAPCALIVCSFYMERLPYIDTHETELPDPPARRMAGAAGDACVATSAAAPPPSSSGPGDWSRRGGAAPGTAPWNRATPCPGFEVAEVGPARAARLHRAPSLLPLRADLHPRPGRRRRHAAERRDARRLPRAPRLRLQGGGDRHPDASGHGQADAAQDRGRTCESAGVQLGRDRRRAGDAAALRRAGRRTPPSPATGRSRSARRSRSPSAGSASCASLPTATTCSTTSAVAARSS